MNRTTLQLLLACLLLCPGGAAAQRLAVQQTTIDCGKTGYMVPVTATFEIKNKSLKRLTISEVKPDCGCTKVTVSRKELGPGDKATIALTYDGRTLGHYVKQAALYTNAAGKPQMLTMKGVVLAELQDYSSQYPYVMGDLLADRNQLEFDDVNKGDHPVQEIHILNNSERTMTPNVQHLPAWLSAVATPEKLLPGRAGKVELTLNSQLIHGFGLTQASVHLAANLGDKVTADNELPVAVVLLPDLKGYEGAYRQYAPRMELTDSVLTLGRTADGKVHKSGTITLTNTGRTALSISSLQMFTPGLKLTLGKRELQPGEQTKLKVAADRQQLLKARQKPRVLMITNDPDHSKVVITVNIQ